MNTDIVINSKNEMRRFLFVSFANDQICTGGIQCSKRNYQSLVDLFGVDNVDRYIIEPYKNRKSVSSRLERVGEILKGYMGGITKQGIKDILRLLKERKITDIFLDNSLLGILSMNVKKELPYIKVFTFFHNFEYDFFKDYIQVNRKYSRIHWLGLAYLNEKMSCKYSDRIISLNSRDAEGIKNMYGRTADIQIPITLPTSYFPGNATQLQVSSSVKTALFVGSYFFGNVQGIKWFCNNVLPLTNIHLIIVGSKMENLKSEIDESEKVTIYNYVPDLTSYYENADFVILPVLSGSGMKVKTAEALLYGKFIIGTSEALCGYEVNDKIAIKCDTVDEFVNAIKSYNSPYKFNKYSRSLYEEKYSFDTSLQLFKKILV